MDEVGPTSTADRRTIPREISTGLGGWGYCHTNRIPADWQDWPALCGFVEIWLNPRRVNEGEKHPIPNPHCPSPSCPLALHKFVRAAMWLAREPMHLRSGCIAGLAASTVALGLITSEG